MSNEDLSPLMNEQGRKLLNQMSQSAAAPIFNHTAGDRIQKEDLIPLDQFRTDLSKAVLMRIPDQHLLDRVEKCLSTVPLYRERIGKTRDLTRDLTKDWHQLPTISRKEIAEHPELLVPDDQDLKRLIVYRTAGTTGHPLLVPHHPQAAAAYQVLIDEALKRCGIQANFEAGRVACFLIGAQKKTLTYPTALSVWNQAGFAKLNINPEDWRKPKHREEYFREFQPEILTGDPISFAALSELEVDIKPKALISTAVAMSAALKKRLEARFAAPVIDWYSLTETGPIGFIKPGEDTYSLLPHDLYVEVLDENGQPSKENEIGEIVVSGGRNPFIPLIRYRTGDYGRRLGDQLAQLEGRKPVFFRSKLNRLINTVDIARVLREYPIIQHFFKQKSDLSCQVILRPFKSGKIFESEKLAIELSELFEGVKVEIKIDPDLGDRSSGAKLMPYVSEISPGPKYEE